MKYKQVLALVGILIVGFCVAMIFYTQTEKQVVKIGVVTPLTGGAAYWGESTRVGVDLARAEAVRRGLNVEFIVEDGQLDPVVALNAAQKLVNVDGVTVLYSEFNPASISISSFLEDKDVFHLYDSAAASPLEKGEHNFKTYLDYKYSCKQTAEYLRESKGVESVAVLKLNIEFGDLCLEGIREVFGNQVVVETYNAGEVDFRTRLQKLTQQPMPVDAIFHASFQPETIASLRNLNELGIETLFVGLSETITDDYRDEIGVLIEGDVFFGLPIVEGQLKEMIKEANGGKDVADYNASALAYVHLVQLAEAAADCDDEMCIAKKMALYGPVSEIGFQGFKNRIAVFDTRIVEYTNGLPVEVSSTE